MIINYELMQKTIDIQMINNEPYFKAKDICLVLGFKNHNQAISNHCDLEGVISGDTLTKGGKQKAIFINEPNLYALIHNSKKPEAKKFQWWVYKEILPTIRKTGQFSLINDINTFQKHLSVENQKNNSKSVNALQYNNGGVEAIKNYNRKNCELHTGLTTTQWKEIGKNRKLPSIKRNSAKQVIRECIPAVACAMSFADSLVAQGKTLENVSPATKAAIQVFDHLLKIGIEPVEFKKID